MDANKRRRIEGTPWYIRERHIGGRYAREVADILVDDDGNTQYVAQGLHIPMAAIVVDHHNRLLKTIRNGR